MAGTLNADVDLAAGDYDVFVSVDPLPQTVKYFTIEINPNKVKSAAYMRLNPAFSIIKRTELFQHIKMRLTIIYYNDPVKYPSIPTGQVPPDPWFPVRPPFPSEIRIFRGLYDSLDSFGNVINAADCYYLLA